MATEAETVPLGVMEIDKEKDIEKKLDEVEFKSKSHIPEVGATVPETDDPSMPCWSFRSVVLGVVWAVVVAGVNQYFWFTSTPIVLGQIACALLAFFMGKAMEYTLPDYRVKVPYLGEFSLNPGPFNMKEHALITIFANAGFQSAYATDILGIQRLFYKQNFGPAYGILLILTTQIAGYGMAGLGRAILVEPPSMWWPTNLPTVALFKTLHEKSYESRMGVHLKFFTIVTATAFVWYFLPGLIMPVLTSISIMCWFNQSSTLVGNIGSGLSGLGVLNFSLDWATITAFLYSPLMYPTSVLINVCVGVAFAAWVVVPAMYYKNVWNAQLFPIAASGSFALLQNDDGTVEAARYNVRSILTPEKILDEDKYNNYSKLHLSIFFALAYGMGFAALTCTIMHVALWHGKEIVKRYRASRTEDGDIHNELMEAYPTVPNWWFGAIFLVTAAVSMFVVLYWPTEMPWWALIFALGMGVFFTIPTGIICATTNILPGTNIITELVIGFILPGRPICNVLFKTYGYISQYQAVTFLQDMKLGMYMKIPPRDLFWAQISGTVVSGLVNYAVMDSIFTNIIKDDDVGVLNGAFGNYTLPNVKVFFTASIVWGVIGPARMFGSGSDYQALNWFWLIGVLAPIPFYLLHQKYPNFGWDNVNVPVMFNGIGILPPAATVNFFTWGAIGVFFNHYIRKRFPTWWKEYNYVLSAALDSGTILSLLFIGLAILLPRENAGFPYFYFGNPNTDENGLTLEYCALP
ncbi:oligopeptide transporter 4 [Gonapodya prolifera JEL478]|uniref:Oligopeptide transporter 4 n=1 Tax=Gonapodya prolifera (strain JEL478) TaxID=1344416 RepID=A0A139A3F0_GONPJ|nr:oligopeptide transporter 4 [Gonapodya prolifera JEL478]|eukprot:KXS11301.1 oligopeptide transporter 4 [Gonapodya prolifera JEL478]